MWKTVFYLINNGLFTFFLCGNTVDTLWIDVDILVDT